MAGGGRHQSIPGGGGLFENQLIKTRWKGHIQGPHGMTAFYAESVRRPARLKEDGPAARQPSFLAPDTLELPLQHEDDHVLSVVNVHRCRKPRRADHVKQIEGPARLLCACYHTQLHPQE